MECRAVSLGDLSSIRLYKKKMDATAFEDFLQDPFLFVVMCVYSEVLLCAFLEK